MYLGQAVKPVLLDCTFHQQERSLDIIILSLANIAPDTAPVKRQFTWEEWESDEIGSACLLPELKHSDST